MSNEGTGHWCPRRGFSLIELVMVLAITGVLAAIAAPRYANSVARYRIDLAAQRIVADLALAQSRAKISSSSRSVTFDPKTSTYTLHGIADFKNPAAEYAVKLSDSPYSAAFDSIDLGGDEIIIFNGFGVPDSGGTIVITGGSLRRTITVNPNTGGATFN